MLLFVLLAFACANESPITWRHCAEETEPAVLCAVDQVSRVRFGVDARWLNLTVQPPGVLCARESFGSDPAPGLHKSCQIAVHAELADDSRLSHAPHKRFKVFDAFTFNGEWLMLEIRVRTLDTVVDVFVICESNTTFSGRPKPLYLTDRLATQPDFLHKYRRKLRIVIAELVPGELTNNASWANEYASRDALLGGLHDVQPEDWVMISDVDEIPRPHAVAQLHSHGARKNVGFPCVMTYFNYRWLANEWFGSPIAHRVENLRKGVQETAWRQADFWLPKHSCWHCSYCFGPDDDAFVEGMRSKLTSFAHIEYSSGIYVERENILKWRDDGRSPFYGTNFTLLETIDAPPVVTVDKRFEFLLGLRQLRLHNPIPRRGVLFDFGAQGGNTASPSLYKFPPFTAPIVVHAFEGNAIFCDELDSFAHVQLSTVSHCPVVIGNREANVTFYLDARSTQKWGSSLSANHPDVLGGALPTTVPMRDIAHVLYEFVHEDDYVILKLDVEGEEHQILPKLAFSPELAKLVDAIYYELHPETHVETDMGKMDVTIFSIRLLAKRGVKMIENFTPTKK
jgi:beta-1,4-mannosyl-glycoprotein beta-1,4-N-acetylglucosaminyltransferase